MQAGYGLKVWKNYILSLIRSFDNDTVSTTCVKEAWVRFLGKLSWMKIQLETGTYLPNLPVSGHSSSNSSISTAYKPTGSLTDVWC
jgi:hypothetical protein